MNLDPVFPACPHLDKLNALKFTALDVFHLGRKKYPEQIMDESDTM
jgi:hypothetical protein